MKKSLIAFTLGIVVGLFLYSVFSGKKEPSSDAQGDTSYQRDPAPSSPKNIAKKSLEFREEDIVTMRATPPPPPTETRTHAPEVVRHSETSKRILQFDFSEPQVSEMERGLESLQKEVSLFREDKGWIVKFYTSQNSLAATSLRDGDLIRFSHLETMKQDPETRDLANRLETVLQSLER